jgi:hypothetical protein
MKAHRIAVMPGDGTGRWSSRRMRVLEAAARKHSLGIEWREFGLNRDYYAKHGRMMPRGLFETLAARCDLLRCRRLARRPCPTTFPCGARSSSSAAGSIRYATCGRAG